MDVDEFRRRAKKRIKEVKRKARPGNFSKTNLTFRIIEIYPYNNQKITTLTRFCA